MEKDCRWTVPPCLGVLGQKAYLPLKEFQGVSDYQVVWKEKMVALAMVLQRCADQSGMPSEKDPTAPLIPTEGASALEPRAEEPIGLPLPDKPPTSEPKEAAHWEELVLVWMRRPLAPPGFTLLWEDESGPPPLENADWLVSIYLAAQLDLAHFGSLQVIVSHYPAIGEVWYQY